MGPALNERSGFLKGEFLDDLKSLPVWTKTRSYCVGFHVFHSHTGKRVSEFEMHCWQKDWAHQTSHTGHIQIQNPASEASIEIQYPGKTSGGISYSLNHHEIVPMGDGQVIWKKCGTHNRITIGNCLIREDILFIGPGEQEEPGILKKEFHQRLKMLPCWNLTRYYLHGFALQDCQSAYSQNRKGRHATVSRFFASPDQNIRGSRQRHRIIVDHQDHPPSVGLHAAQNTVKPIKSFFQSFFEILKSRTISSFSKWRGFHSWTIKTDNVDASRYTRVRSGMKYMWYIQKTVCHILKFFSFRMLQIIRFWRAQKGQEYRLKNTIKRILLKFE